MRSPNKIDPLSLLPLHFLTNHIPPQSLLQYLFNQKSIITKIYLSPPYFSSRFPGYDNPPRKTNQSHELRINLKIIKFDGWANRHSPQWFNTTLFFDFEWIFKCRLISINNFQTTQFCHTKYFPPPNSTLLYFLPTLILPLSHSHRANIHDLPPLRQFNYLKRLSFRKNSRLSHRSSHKILPITCMISTLPHQLDRILQLHNSREFNKHRPTLLSSTLHILIIYWIV